MEKIIYIMPEIEKEKGLYVIDYAQEEEGTLSVKKAVFEEEKEAIDYLRELKRFIGKKTMPCKNI